MRKEKVLGLLSGSVSPPKFESLSVGSGAETERSGDGVFSALPVTGSD